MNPEKRSDGDEGKLPEMERVCWDSSSALLQAQGKENRVLEQLIFTACDDEELATPERADELLRQAIETHECVIQDLRLARERIQSADRGDEDAEKSPQAIYRPLSR